jgi:hypothetical protein
MARQIVIAINGYARSGKDTVCEYVIDRLHKRGWRGHSVSSIDPVRNMLRDLGVPVDLKRPAERDLMAEVKSALERYSWWSTRLCAQQVHEWMSMVPQAPSLCFAHMRETAAIEKFVTLFGPTVVTRTLLVRSPREERVMSNVADANVEGMAYDLTIENDGTLDDLREKCFALADFLMEELKSDDDFIEDDTALAEHGGAEQGAVDPAAALSPLDTRGAADAPRHPA